MAVPPERQGAAGRSSRHRSVPVGRQGSTGRQVALVCNKQQADGVGMARPAESIVDERDVEAELAEVLGLELPGLELGYHVAELFDVEKE